MIPSSLQSLMVTADHAVPLTPNGSTIVVQNTGDTLFFADNPQVSASSNQGSIGGGGTRSFTSTVWVRSAGLSALQLLTGPTYSTRPMNIFSRGVPLLRNGFSANSSVIILPSALIFNPQDGKYYVPYGDGASFGLAQSSTPDGPWTNLGYPSGLPSAAASQQHRVLLTPDKKWSWYATPDQVTISLYQTAAGAAINSAYSLTGSCITQGPATWDAGKLGEMYVFRTATATAGAGAAGTWVMLYRGEDNPAASEQVGMAISSGDHTGPYTKVAANPVIPKSGLGVFDDQVTADPIVLFFNNVYYIFYAYCGPNTFQGGVVTGAAVCGTALVTTTDFVTFTKRGIVFPTGLIGQPDCAHALNGDFWWPGRTAGTNDDLTCALPSTAMTLYHPYFARNLTSGDASVTTSGWMSKVDPQSIYDGTLRAGAQWQHVAAEGFSLALTTTGSWTHDSTSSISKRGCTGSAYVWSNTANDFQTIAWTGTRARVWLGESSANGIANIILDGTQVAQVDTFGGVGEVSAGFMLGYDTGDLLPGPHTLTVQVSGTHNAASTGNFIYIDAWDYIGTTGVQLPYAQTVLVDAPTGYWRLNETSGTVATDSSGNGLNGTYVGGVTLAQGSILTDPTSKAITLNGSTGYMYVPDNALLRLGSSFTVECWVKSSNFAALVTKGGTLVNFFLQTVAGGSVRLNVDPTHSGTGAAAEVAVNAWNHVVATYDGVNVRIYINALLKDTIPTTQSGQSVTAQSLMVGSWSDSTSTPPGIAAGPLNGSITEVAVYKTPLSGTRIGAHYTAGTA